MKVFAPQNVLGKAQKVAYVLPFAFQESLGAVASPASYQSLSDRHGVLPSRFPGPPGDYHQFLVAAGPFVS
jgi:hypothetical protein